MPLLHTVSPTLGAQLQISVTASAPVRKGGGRGEEGVGDAEIGYIIEAALQRYLEKKLEVGEGSLSVLSVARDPCDGGGEVGGGGRATVSVVLVLKCGSAEALVRAGVLQRVAACCSALLCVAASCSDFFRLKVDQRNRS